MASVPADPISNIECETMKLRNIVTGAAGLLAMTFTAAAVMAAPARNVVLVHGALADGSGWKGLYDRLRAKGFEVSIVQEPETGFEEDVQAVRRVIAMQNRPVVLVGHSYGGQIVTEVGADPKVAALVYVAAAVPDVGEGVKALFERTPSPTNDIKPNPDGYLMLDPQKFHADFAADVPVDQADFMARSQVLVNAKAFGTPVTTAAWKTKPSYGIVAGADRIVSPDIERWMYKRANAQVTEVAGASHAVYVSHPDEVAAVIEMAASR